MAIELALFSALIDFKAVTANHLVAYLVVILLGATGISIGLALLWVKSAEFSGRLWRKLLVKLVWRELKKRYSDFSAGVPATGIGNLEGSAVVRLGLGEDDGVTIGYRFQVTNTATEELLGTIECITLDQASCLCVIADRASAEFWEQLESRMRGDPSPPTGVVFSREAPASFLKFVELLLDD